MALRFYSRYVDMRGHAAFAGGDLSDHGPLPTERDADQRYEAAVEDWLFETPASNDAVLALVEFAGVIAADRLIGEITRDPVNDERDAFHQVIALAAVGGWLNDIVRSEWLDRIRHEAGTKPKAGQDDGDAA